MDNHGVLVVGDSVADAWHQLYFLERACEVQVLAQSTGSPLAARAGGGRRAHGRAVPPRGRSGRAVRSGATRARSRQSRLRAYDLVVRGGWYPRTVVVGDVIGRRSVAGGGRRDRAPTLDRASPDALLLLATGDTPMGAYRELAERQRRGELDTSQLRAAQLDEYASLGTDDRRSLYGWMAALVPRAAGRARGAAIRLDARAPARRRVPRLRRRRGGGGRLRARRARPRAERPSRLQRASDRTRRPDPARAADAREHPQQRALLGRRGRRAARGADVRPGHAAGGAADPARRLRPAQARDPAPHPDRRRPRRRAGVLAAAGRGRRRRARRPRRLPGGRRPVSSAAECGHRLDRDFTISLWLEVPADRAGAAGGLASKFDRGHPDGLQPQRDLERRRLQRPGRRAAHLLRDRRGQRAALVRSRTAVADLELRQQLAHRVRRVALTPRPRMPPTRPIAVTSTAIVGEHRVGGSRQGRARGRARRRAADRHRGSPLRGDLELRLDARPRAGSRALPRVPLRRRPAAGRTAAQPGRSKRLFSLASYRGDLLATGDDSTRPRLSRRTRHGSR